MLQLVAEEAGASKTKIQVFVRLFCIGKADSFFRVHETLLIATVSRGWLGLSFYYNLYGIMNKIAFREERVQLFEQSLEIFYIMPQRLSLPLQELREDRINQRLAN